MGCKALGVGFSSPEQNEEMLEEAGGLMGPPTMVTILGRSEQRVEQLGSPGMYTPSAGTGQPPGPSQAPLSSGFLTSRVISPPPAPARSPRHLTRVTELDQAGSRRISQPGRLLQLPRGAFGGEG